MKKNTSVPHDAAFKAFLTHPDTAREFIELHLPPALRDLCDLRTLKLESGSFVEESLNAFYSDVLYSLKTASGEGYIHVLIEHQSTPDRHMAFRLMRYAVAAMQRHLDAGHHKLPLVIPVLFYTGRRTPYPYGTNWLDDFDDPQLAERLYSEAFPLVDVTVIPDDDIMHHRSLAALTLLQKHIHRRNLADLQDRLAATLVSGCLTGQQLSSLINYLLLAGEVDDAEAFVRNLARKMPLYEDQLMTIAEQLEQKGLEQGLKKGLEQGLEKGLEKGLKKGLETGRQEGKREVARNLILKGMEMQLVKELTGLSDHDLAQISH